MYRIKLDCKKTQTKIVLRSVGNEHTYTILLLSDESLGL